jgi:(4-(4-[2-(gamma-L-glutamylamino)ethyl]phenoxymethyl)furan-2-yl)methanamine synthase
MSFIIGWDVGGAHLKAAVLNPQRKIIQVQQQPCKMWKGLSELEAAISVILKALPEGKHRHAITMTGELVDFFASRDEGVAKIIATMQHYLADAQTQWIYAGTQGFIESRQVKPEDYPVIASANWLASASLVAQKLKTALFVDIGSTTTDILLCENGIVQAVGLTDYQRLQSQELVYTGIIRTAVMAVSQKVFFKGQPQGLMAEYFATMADVYRLSGELNEIHDQTETADGGEKTLFASGKRLSRMIGYEFSTQDLPLWRSVALQLKYQQKQQIQSACLRQLSRYIHTTPPVVVGAGVGRFLVQQIAADLGYDYQDVADFLPHTLTDSAISVADCAPAAAVAYLAERNI